MFATSLSSPIDVAERNGDELNASISGFAASIALISGPEIPLFSHDAFGGALLQSGRGRNLEAEARSLAGGTLQRDVTAHVARQSP